MAPTFFLIPGGVFFALLCVPCLLILVIGILVHSKPLKWIGGMTLFINASFVGAAVVGCFYLAGMESLMLLTGPYTRSRPNPEDLAGTYRPTSRSIRFIKRKRYDPVPPIRIILHDDGKFEMKNIPDMWMNFGRATGDFDSGSGTWELDSRHYPLVTLWGLTLDFDDTENFTSRDLKTGLVFSMLKLKGQRPPYIIHMVIGDPDGLEALEFETRPTDHRRSPLTSIFRLISWILTYILAF